MWWLLSLIPLSAAETGDVVETPCDTPTDFVPKSLPWDGDVGIPRNVQPVLVLAPCRVESARRLTLWASRDTGLEPVYEDLLPSDPTGEGGIVAFDPGLLEANIAYLLELTPTQAGDPTPTVFQMFETGTAVESTTPAAPSVLSMWFDASWTGHDVRAFASITADPVDGLVALFPTDGSATTLEELSDLALVRTAGVGDPVNLTIDQRVDVPVGEERCLVARHRSLAGAWSAASPAVCATAWDPTNAPDTGFFPDDIFLGGPGCGCSASSGSGAIWLGLFAPLLVAVSRRGSRGAPGPC